MDSLDDLSKIAELDKGNILGSIDALPRQVSQAWQEVSDITSQLPEDYHHISNIVVSGMGGSALPGRVLHSLLLSSNLAPLEVVTGYTLPNYVRGDTLVILSSYSGNTAETLSAANEAQTKGAKIFIVTTGGKLAEIASAKSIPAYIFEPKENPSNQPRMALGYAITANLALLSGLGFVKVEGAEIKKVVSRMETDVATMGVRAPQKENLAKIYSGKLKNKVPIIISSSHLVGATHAFKNQLNENSKSFAMNFDIPELNHHLLEGLKNPSQIKTLFHFLFFDSELYPDEVKKRYPITLDVVEKNGVESDLVKLRGSTKMEQVYELLVLGSYVSFYLAIAYDIDPSPIPWVDYFKNELAKK